GASPPSGVNESCMALTEPFDAAVVVVAHNAELTMPNRTSFPSMLPPDCESLACMSMFDEASSGLGCCSAQTQKPTSGTKITNITASTAQPWRVSPTMTPNV